MSNRVSKIFQYLRGKLYSFLRFVKFLVVPQSRMMKITMIGSFVFFIFVFGHFAFAGLGDQIIGIINVLLYYIAFALGWVAMKIFALIIWVSQYNDFVTSPAVEKGWVLVRDICNMFFVVILLVIAFAQILGVQKYSMKTMLPKVLIAAILVNFSKLLCGLMIDLAQVVMMTFVNGYQATAGANLINGLGLTKLLKLNDAAREGNPGGGGVDASQITLALVIAIFIIIATIFVSFFIAVLLLLRIVTLWILVVLSPAAFALSTVPFGQSKYNEWWQKFGWNVAVGPFMAFFLWLSLLIMSNPQDMMGSNTNLADAQTAIAEKSGSSSGSTTYLDNLAQAAIGLAMLFASLIVAQEAGGAMASLASTGQKFTSGALKTVAMRASGAKAVMDRGAAVKAGWSERAQAKQQAKMAKYKRAGARAQGYKEAGLQRLKRAPVAPIDAIKGARSEKTIADRKAAYTEAKDSAYKKAIQDGMSATDATKAARRAGKKASRKVLWKNMGESLDTGLRVGRLGSLESRMAGAAKNLDLKERRDEAKDILNARGISSKEDKEALLKSTRRTPAGKDLQKAAAMSLAEDGDMTVDLANKAMDLFKSSGDGLGQKELKKELMKKQAHLAFGDLTRPENVRKLGAAIDAGDVDLSKLDESSYKDSLFMASAYSAVGGKKFSSDMEKASKRSQSHKETISEVVSNPAFANGVLRDLDLAKADVSVAATSGDPEKIKKAQAAYERKKEAYEGSGKTLAGITRDLTGSFTVKVQNHDPDAPGYASRAKPDQLGLPVAGKDGGYEIDEASLAKYIKGASAKTLASVKLSPSVNATVAQSVSVPKLKGLVNSTEDGAENNFNEIISAIVEGAEANVDGMLSKVQSMISVPDIQSAISGEMKKRIEKLGGEIKTSVGEVKKEVKDAKDSTETSGLIASANDADFRAARSQHPPGSFG